MDNMPMPATPTSSMANLPHKSTFWIVGMIFISGFLASVIGGMIIAFIVLKNQGLYLYVYPLALILNILGTRYGVKYVIKKSLVYPNEIAKVSLLVGVPYLLLYLWGLRSGANLQAYILGFISVAVAVGSVWYFLKQKVR